MVFDDDDPNEIPMNTGFDDDPNPYDFTWFLMMMMRTLYISIVFDRQGGLFYRSETVKKGSIQG